jgi:hypothetical protein
MKRATRGVVLGVLAVASATALAVACGDVPTLEDGVAYYTPVQLPLPTVALGDTLRDSLGVARPLRIQAFTRDSQGVSGLSVFFLPTTLPSLVKIDSATGFVVANDTATGTVQIVGRIGARLQTSVTSLLVVPEPTAIASADVAPGDTLELPVLKELPVTVTGTYKGASATVTGIIVRYRIDSLVPATLPPGSAILVNDNAVPQRPDSTVAVDTTSAAGTAMRKLLVLAGSGVQRVYVSASARRLHNAAPLEGSPVRFVVEIKPQPAVQ